MLRYKYIAYLVFKKNVIVMYSIIGIYSLYLLKLVSPVAQSV